MRSPYRQSRGRRAAVAGTVLALVVLVGVTGAATWAVTAWMDSSRPDVASPETSASAGVGELEIGPPVPVPAAPCPAGSEPVASRVEMVREVALESVGVAQTRALSYVPRARSLLAADASADLPVVTLFGDRAGSWATPELGAGADGAVWHELLGAMLLWNRGDAQLSMTPAPSSIRGDGVPAEVTTLDLRALAIDSVDAVAVDMGAGDVYVADGAGRIVRIPFRPGSARHAPALDLGASCALAVELTSGSRLGALAVSPRGGHVFAMETADEGSILHELNSDGSPLAVHDAAALGIGPTSAMVVAPRSDPSTIGASLYLAEAGGGGARLVELEIGPASAPTIQHVSLVGATRTSEWPQPSADPCGIAWDARAGRFVVTDPEVEELPLFGGVNVFELDQSREPVQAGMTEFTTEPSDVAIDPVTGDYFVSDDSAARIHHVETGPDRILGGADDETTSVPTASFGSTDPDGLAVGQGGLFVTDGAHDLLFRVSFGPDGELTGIPPSGDDVVVSFDTASLGVTDPEAVAFDPRRGTLFMVSDDGRPRLVEVSTAGSVLRTLDLGFLPITSASGLTFAPSTDDPRRESLFLVDRGLDRTDAPDQNDGLLFELRLEDGDLPDLARNGGFELDVDANGVPDGWELENARLIGGEGRAGDAAVTLTAHDQVVGRVRLDAPVNERANGGVAVTAWVRATPGTVAGVVVRIAWHDADGAVLRRDRLTDVIVGPTWTEMRGFAVPPPGAADARLSVEVHSGAAVIDDISLAVP